MAVKTPLILFLTLIAWLPGFAQSKAEEKAAASAPEYSKEAFVVESYHSRIVSESDGSGTRELSSEVKILAEAGVKAFAVLNFTYTSANEVVEVDYVRVRKPNGTVVKTPDYNIQDMPAEVTRTAPLYSDIHEKHIAVKGLSVGDVLEYQLRQRIVKPEVPGHFWYEYSFAKDLIVKEEKLEISVPKEKYVKVVSPDFKPEVSDEGTRRVYRWTHSNLVVKEKDPDEIPRRIPPNPSVQVTTFASWEEVGRWYGGLQKDPLQVTPAIQAKAQELTKGMKTDEEKIRALYNFVSLRYHYIGLDFGIGRYQPHAADDVLDNGYGDCKDKHTLLAALLKAAGYDAWPALIHSVRQLDPEVPSPAQFNHVITVVPQGGQLTWLDTTPEVAPFGLLLTALRDKQALVIPSNKDPMLVRTPQNPPIPQDQEFSLKGKLSSDDVLSAHVEQRYEGGDVEVVLRAMLRQVPESQWKETVQGFSYRLGFIGDVSNVKVSPPEEIDKPLQISYDYVRRNFGEWKERQITAPLPNMGIEVTKDSKEKKPLEPVLLGAVGKIVYRSQVELPPGYSMFAPSAINLVKPYAEYHTKNVFEDGMLTTSREFIVKKPQVETSEWEDFRKFGRAIADDEFAMITLTGGSTVGEGKGSTAESSAESADELFREAGQAFQQRHIGRAQELFERVIAKDPNYKRAHLGRGMALVMQNRISDALAEFHKEEDLAPNDPQTYTAAAALLTVKGRNEEAAEELRRLLKVDPQNHTAATTLGGLLYEAGKYPEVVEVLEKAAKTPPENSSLQFLLGEAYLKTGQNDKAVASLRQSVELKDDPDTLNNAAYTLAENKLQLDLARQWAEKSIAKLEEEAQASESAPDVGMRVTYQFSLVWDTLGWVYYQQGNAQKAEGLVRAAWLLGEDSDVMAEHLGEIYEKEGKTQQAAKMYLNAMAVSSDPMSPLGVPQNELEAYKKRTNELAARYKKVTGKEPGLTEVRRLPNGRWTLTPAEELRHSREVKVSNEGKLSGAAAFAVEFKPTGVDSADYLSGDETLKPLSDKLTDANYPLEFPPESGAILVVRVEVKCASKTAPCVGTIVNPVPVPNTSPAW